jgi:hypothetical protein
MVSSCEVFPMSERLTDETSTPSGEVSSCLRIHLPFLMTSGLPHFMHLSLGGCSVLHFGQTTTNRAPQLVQVSSARDAGLPHFGHGTSRTNPQLLQRFQPFSIGWRHFGHLDGPSGFDLPQYGHAFESGGTSSPQ